MNNKINKYFDTDTVGKVIRHFCLVMYIIIAYNSVSCWNKSERTSFMNKIYKIRSTLNVLIFSAISIAQSLCGKNFTVNANIIKISIVSFVSFLE